MTKRVKVLTLHEDFALSLFTTGAEMCYRITDGLPQDATLLKADLRHDGTLALLIESKDFEPVEEGVYPPEFVATAEKLHEGDKA